MIGEIISVGTEITTGSILNTNTKYLSTKLMELGIETYYHSSVDDNDERLAEVVNIALKRADVIITTGGLGPTQDDLTKEVISAAMELELEMDKDMEKSIMDMFSNMNRPMTENNRKQAIKPKGSEFIINDIGTAPGIFINKDSRKVIMLPGPPREMSLMFEKYVIPLIKEDYSIISRSINLSGIGESSLETDLKALDIWEYRNINIATFVKEGDIEIKIIGKGKEKDIVESEIDEIISTIEYNLHEFIFGYENIPIEKIVYDLLVKNNMKIGLCESCTGGLISSRLTRLPGASNVLDRTIVSYSNESKIDELHIEPEIISEYGAVSGETALAMAKGLFEKANLDLVLSITGIAGPSGGTEDKPVGLVYICIYNNEKYNIIKCNINGNRISIQNRAATKAFIEIQKFLTE